MAEVTHYSVQVLNLVLEKIPQAPFFLLDTFFGNTLESEQDDIFFDLEERKLRLAPFVHPLVEGKVVDNIGYETRSFRPAYVKDKRQFRPTAPIRRVVGEQFSGTLSREARRARLIRQNMEDQLEMLGRREEVMASEALRTGRVTVTGERYPTKVVDYGRHNSLTFALIGGARWGEAGISPLSDLETWAGLVQTQGGGAANTVVMDPLAWSLARKDPQLDKLLDRQAMRQAPTMNMEPFVQPRGTTASFKGVIGDFSIWTYQDTYVDESDTVQKMIPDYTVMMADSRYVEGRRCYGLIRDEDLGFEATRYYSKSWTEPDPSVRWMLMQSAPLVVPFRPNCTLCATVR